MPSEENDEDRTMGVGDESEDVDAETIKLQHDIQKLNALQYLLNDEAMEELNHDVAVMKANAEVSSEDSGSLAGIVKRRKSSINLRLKEFQEALKGNKLVDGGRKLKAFVDDKKLRKLISEKKKQLDEKLLHPRFVDRIAFFLGILVVCISEFIILRCPEAMYIWYTILIFPLMAIRFFMYHKLKFHYFMLDFCYLCQFLLLFYLFASKFVLDSSETSNLFKLVFCLSNGPLAWGTIVWRNKLVFHDIDKVTSVFIHVCPPLVTYCLRWYSPSPQYSIPPPIPATPLTLWEAVFVPMVIYVFWQVAYYMKTEVVDRKKLKNDQDIMTSSRWMTVKEPHPIYKYCVKRGYKGDGVMLLMLVQMVYTPATLVFLPLFYRYFWLHTIFLGFVFFSVLWEGATYYFESFTEAYQKRLEKAKNPVAGRKMQSFASSMLFFSSVVGALMGVLKVLL